MLRIRCRLAAGFVSCLIAVGGTTAWVDPTPAQATPAADRAGDGGATSRISGDRIITTIFGQQSGSRRRGRVITSSWVTFTATQVAYLLQVASVDPAVAGHPAIRDYGARAVAGTADDLSIQYRVVNGRANGEVRLVSISATAASGWSRQMVTVVPPLRPTLSPPGGLAVPVSQPVFISYTPQVWGQVVQRTLSSNGVTARVRAWPVRFEARSGDPAAVGQVTRCPGRGQAYDPGDPASPAQQARRPGVCTLPYRSRTGIPGRPSSWIGDVTVWWWAEWSTDGRRWRPLGEIPRLTALPRAVRDVPTALEARP